MLLGCVLDAVAGELGAANEVVERCAPRIGFGDLGQCFPQGIARSALPSTALKGGEHEGRDGLPEAAFGSEGIGVRAGPLGFRLALPRVRRRAVGSLVFAVSKGIDKGKEAREQNQHEKQQSAPAQPLSSAAEIEVGQGEPGVIGGIGKVALFPFLWIAPGEMLQVVSGPGFSTGDPINRAIGASKFEMIRVVPLAMDLLREVGRGRGG